MRTDPRDPADRIAPRLLAMLDRIGAMPAWKPRVSSWKSTTGQGGAALGSKPRGTALTNATGACARRMRGDDLVADLGGGTFGVVLHPVAAARLGIRDAIADRLRAGLGAPPFVGETIAQADRVVGHAALGSLPGGSRSDPHRRHTCAAGGAGSPAWAPSGLIVGAHAVQTTNPFAPVRGRSGRAGLPRHPTRGSSRRSTREPGRSRGSRRWRAGTHPVHGLLAPDRFSGRRNMPGAWRNFATRDQATTPWRRCARWDHAGTRVAHRFGQRLRYLELRNPSYAEQVAWDLDAAGIAPERLIIEVLESVAADARDDADHGHARGPAQPGHRPRP
jgi:hypothetical protein